MSRPEDIREMMRWMSHYLENEKNNFDPLPDDGSPGDLVPERSVLMLDNFTGSGDRVNACFSSGREVEESDETLAALAQACVDAMCEALPEVTGRYRFRMIHDRF